MKRSFTSIWAFLLSFVLLWSFVSCTAGIGTGNSTSATQNSTTASTTGSSVVNIDFYSINDLHGTVKDTEENSGIGKITTFLNSKAERQIHSSAINASSRLRNSIKLNQNIIKEFNIEDHNDKFLS